MTLKNDLPKFKYYCFCFLYDLRSYFLPDYLSVFAFGHGLNAIIDRRNCVVLRQIGGDRKVDKIYNMQVFCVHVLTTKH